MPSPQRSPWPSPRQRPTWRASPDQWKKDDELKKAILDGVKADGKEVMPSFKDEVTPEQADALVKYTRTFKK